MPLASLPPDALRPAPALFELALRLAPRQRLGVGPHALRKIPESVSADAAGHRDLAAAGQHVHHQPQRAATPPRMPLVVPPRVIFEVARKQRPVPLDLAQDVSAETRVLPQEVLRPEIPLGLQVPEPASPRHA